MQGSSIMKDTYHMNHEQTEVHQKIALMKLVTVMLVITLCWWFYDGDRYKMLVTESLCWRLFSLCWWFFQCIKSVTNILNLSPKHFVSNIRHQHRCHHEIAVSDGAIYKGRHRIGNRSPLAYNVVHIIRVLWY